MAEVVKPPVEKGFHFPLSLICVPLYVFLLSFFYGDKVLLSGCLLGIIPFTLFVWIPVTALITCFWTIHTCSRVELAVPLREAVVTTLSTDEQFAVYQAPWKVLAYLVSGLFALTLLAAQWFLEPALLKNPWSYIQAILVIIPLGSIILYSHACSMRCWMLIGDGAVFLRSLVDSLRYWLLCFLVPSIVFLFYGWITNWAFFNSNTTFNVFLSATFVILVFLSMSWGTLLHFFMGKYLLESTILFRECWQRTGEENAPLVPTSLFSKWPEIPNDSQVLNPTTEAKMEE